MTPSPDMALQVQALQKRYGSMTAVDGISFSVRRGEVFGLLGPNGAGKTTTLEMVEGLRKPDEGEAWVAGHDAVAQSRKVRERIGVQLQEAALFDLLTVVETLQTFAGFHRRTLDIEPLIERLGLQEKRGALVKELSGGQRQRLSIAIALLNDPDVVFLDEPTTGLDPQARRNLWDVVESIRTEGRTVVLTTHYMEEAARLCERVAIMDHGRIIALDRPAELVGQYAPGALVHLTGAAVNGQASPSVPDEVVAGEGSAGSSAAEDRGFDGTDGGWRAVRGVERVDAATESGTVSLHTTDVQQTLYDIVTRQQSDGLTYEGLRVEQPTLEDVFLNLTGRSLRE